MVAISITKPNKLIATTEHNIITIRILHIITIRILHMFSDILICDEFSRIY